jgi:hypothetical protein
MEYLYLQLLNGKKDLRIISRLLVYTSKNKDYLIKRQLSIFFLSVFLPHTEFWTLQPLFDARYLQDRKIKYSFSFVLSHRYTNSLH